MVPSRLGGSADGIVDVEEETLGVPDAPGDVEVLDVVEALEVLPVRLAAGRVGVELGTLGRRVRRHLCVPAVGEAVVLFTLLLVDLPPSRGLVWLLFGKKSRLVQDGLLSSVYVPIHDVVGKIKRVEARCVGLLVMLALLRNTTLWLNGRLLRLISRLSMGGAMRRRMRGSMGWRMRRGRRFDSSGEGAGCE